MYIFFIWILNGLFIYSFNKFLSSTYYRPYIKYKKYMCCHQDRTHGYWEKKKNQRVSWRYPFAFYKSAWQMVQIIILKIKSNLVNYFIKISEQNESTKMVSITLPSVEYRDFMVKFFIKDNIWLRCYITK